MRKQCASWPVIERIMLTASVYTVFMPSTHLQQNHSHSSQFHPQLQDTDNCPPPPFTEKLRHKPSQVGVAGPETRRMCWKRKEASPTLGRRGLVIYNGHFRVCLPTVCYASQGSQPGWSKVPAYLSWGGIAIDPMLLLIVLQVGKVINCMMTLITSSIGADQHFTAHSLTPGD